MIHGGLNSISGSRCSYRVWMVLPFNGGKTSKLTSVLPLARATCSVTFMCLFFLLGAGSCRVPCFGVGHLLIHAFPAGCREAKSFCRRKLRPGGRFQQKLWNARASLSRYWWAGRLLATSPSRVAYLRFRHRHRAAAAYTFAKTSGICNSAFVQSNW